MISNLDATSNRESFSSELDVFQSNAIRAVRISEGKLLLLYALRYQIEVLAINILF